MNKRTLSTGLGIAAVLLVLLLVLVALRNPNDAESRPDGKGAGKLQNTDVTANSDMPLDIKRMGPLRRIRTQRHSPTNNLPSAVSPMSPESSDNIEEMFVATEQLDALLDTGDNESALKEARRLAMHPNREVRMAALMGMEWIGAPAAADMLLFLTDSDSEIMREAEEAFWAAIDELDDPAIQLALLKTSLKTSTPAMRLEALDKLFFLPDVLSFGVIASMLDDPDASVQTAARDQLEFVSDETFKSEQDAMIWFDQHKDELDQLEMW